MAPADGITGISTWRDACECRLAEIAWCKQEQLYQRSGMSDEVFPSAVFFTWSQKLSCDQAVCMGRYANQGAFVLAVTMDFGLTKDALLTILWISPRLWKSPGALSGYTLAMSTSTACSAKLVAQRRSCSIHSWLLALIEHQPLAEEWPPAEDVAAAEGCSASGSQAARAADSDTGCKLLARKAERQKKTSSGSTPSGSSSGSCPSYTCPPHLPFIDLPFIAHLHQRVVLI